MCQNEQICLYEGFRFSHKYAKLFYIIYVVSWCKFCMKPMGDARDKTIAMNLSWKTGVKYNFILNKKI